MGNSIIVTLKGALNSSIDILMNSMYKVGEKISFDNITELAPTSYNNYTQFFYRCINFCTINGSRLFHIDGMQWLDGKFEFRVSPVHSLPLERKL